MDRRFAVGLAVVALVLLGSGIAVADTTTTAVACTSDGATLSCPLPAPETVTASADPVTVTADPVTDVSTVTADPVTVTSTVAGPTVTVTATSASTIPTTAATTVAPTTTPAPSGAWPGAGNTGVPAGTALTAFTGSCNISAANTVITGKTLNCDVVVNAAGIKISNSQINGRIASTNDSGSITITDSNINGGLQETFPAVGQENVTLLRVNVVGGQHSVQCWADCSVTDSWLHQQYLPSTSAGHVNAFISNGGGPFTIKHNTLDCSVTSTSKGGGCTADLSLFGDFDKIHDVAVTGNLFVSHSTQAYYCTQAGYNPGKSYPNPSNVSYSGNVFQRGANGKCGQGGPVTAFNSGFGDSWTSNTWDNDGSLVPPA